MKPTLTDYVTTETVVQAFSGAKDMAQAGAAATVQYYVTAQIVDIVFSGLFIAISIGLITYGLFRDDKGSVEEIIRVFALIGGIILFLCGCVECAGSIADLCNPEGALLYKIVTGVAQ